MPSWSSIVGWMTFWIPQYYPRGSSDQKYAWRQKLTVCMMMIIWGIVFVLVCAVMPVCCIILKNQYLSEAQCSIAVPIYSIILGLLLFSYLAKFLGSLLFHFRSATHTSNSVHSNIIVHIPCYTENEAEMRRVLHGVRDAKISTRSRKLMFIVVDGLVAGKKCNRLTAQCVMEILSGGYDRTTAAKYTYLSLGHGEKQENAVDVYHGFLSDGGCPVPYIVVVKCGNPHVEDDTGNRGKRDSQFVLFHVLKNLAYGDTIGEFGHGIIEKVFELTRVPLQEFEFVVTVDADTKVDTRCLQYFQSYMTNHPSTIAVCGDSEAENGTQQWVAAMQVFERFMDTNMLRPFEAYFGCVICLPGFLSFFRIMSADRVDPILVDKEVHEAYFNFALDTLHQKNIIIGEDRLLTRLLLRKFPAESIEYVKESTSRTIVPHTWSALMSQRRRWLNTTLHNAYGFLSLPKLPLPVKTTLAIDLFNSFCLPAVLIVVATCAWITTSRYGWRVLLLLIGGLIATRVMIILKTRQFHMIKWMFVYLISEPIVWLVIMPIHAYWNMDNVSWGNTRKVNTKMAPMNTKPTRAYVALEEIQLQEKVQITLEEKIAIEPHVELGETPAKSLSAGKRRLRAESESGVLQPMVSRDEIDSGDRVWTIPPRKGREPFPPAGMPTPAWRQMAFVQPVVPEKAVEAEQETSREPTRTPSPQIYEV